MRLWASSEMSAQDKADCLDALISFIVRRAVCGLTTKNYNKFFLMVVARLNEVGWTKAGLVDFLLEQKQESGRMPRDEEFYEKWCNAPAYKNLQSARTRAILEEVELHKRTTFHEVDQLAESLTVEHILPTTWRTSWPMSEVPNRQLTNVVQRCLLYRRMRPCEGKSPVVSGSKTALGTSRC